MRSILNILGASESFRKHRQALLDSQFVLISCDKVGKASPVIRLCQRGNSEMTLMRTCNSEVWKKSLEKENTKHDCNKTKNRKLAGILEKGFMFHPVTVLSSTAVLTAEWYRLESSLCNCQAEGFKVGFKQVFQSDRQILVLRSNIDCKASLTVRWMQITWQTTVLCLREVNVTQCFLYLESVLFFITKRIIKIRLKIEILFSDNHELVMAAWKFWPDTLWTLTKSSYFSSKSIPCVGCPKKLFTTIWHKGKHFWGEGFIGELMLWSWKYSLIR